MSTIGSFSVEWAVCVNLPRDETDKLTPPNAEVTNEWSCTSSAPYMPSTVQWDWSAMAHITLYFLCFVDRAS